MIIDNTDIRQTFLLIQTNVEGILDLPSRKKTLKQTGFEAKDIVMEEYHITVTMVGFYDEFWKLASVINALDILFKSKLVHDISIPSMGFSCQGVFTDGVKTTLYPAAKAMEVKIKFAVNQPII